MANTSCKFIKLRPDSSYDSEILRATFTNALYDKLILLIDSIKFHHSVRFCVEKDRILLSGEAKFFLAKPNWPFLCIHKLISHDFSHFATKKHL